MDRKEILQRLFTYLVFLILFLSLGIYTGIRNSEDDIFQELEFPQIKDNVQVYRDDLGTPTIIASNIEDLIFAQGYEFARDRSWQLEFYHAIINGELAKLFGLDLVEEDVLLRSFDFPSIAANTIDSIDNKYIKILTSYVDGINTYFEQHKFNLPWEFEALGINPSEWTVIDSLAMQGVLAYILSMGNLNNELLRVDLIQQLGMTDFLDLFPPNYTGSKNYYLGLNESFGILSTDNKKPFKSIINMPRNAGFASNNWVLSGNLTTTGNPFVVNDPHMSLDVPGFWYQVNLQIADGGINVQGFSIPGVPMVLIGHNKDVAWSATASMTDGIDLFYSPTNLTHYFNKDVWKPLIIQNIKIEVAGNLKPIEREIKFTEFGPMINTTNGLYSIKWTLLEKYSKNVMFQSMYLLNTAKNIYDVHNALEFFGSPGFNFVFAEVAGNIAYQNAGIVPIRETGFGYIPINASYLESGWIDTINYSDMLFEVNPKSGYIATANNRVDKESNYYISEDYALDYRIDRINQILTNPSILTKNQNNKFSVIDMQTMQADVYNTAASDLLTTIDDVLSERLKNESNVITRSAIEELINWDYFMDSDSIGATLFATLRIFLITEVFGDDIKEETLDDIDYIGFQTIVQLLKTNMSSSWFDDKNTKNVFENGTTIINRAMNRTISYLIENQGVDMNDWKWGLLHQVSFKHVMGDSAPFLTGLNLGPTPSSGSTFTINSFLNSPSLEQGIINYESSYGPSFRLIMEVTSDWNNVYGILAPGISGVPFSEFYDNGLEDYFSFTYNKWIFNGLAVVLKHTLTFEFIPGEK